MIKEIAQISVIVVSYNSDNDLIVLLPSMGGIVGEGRAEIIVVDNGSLDRSVDYARQHGARIFRMENNRGYAAAANFGAVQAVGEVLVFVNPDVVVGDSAFWEKLAGNLKLLDQQTIGYIDQTETNGERRIILHPFPLIHRRLNRYFGKRLLGSPDPCWVEGGFLCLRKELFRQLDGFDERFIQFGEDLDFCYRAIKAGCRLWRIAELKVAHPSREHLDKRRIVLVNYLKFYRKYRFPAHHLLGSLYLRCRFGFNSPPE